MKSDKKGPFCTFLKYDKEIKDEVETEERELSDPSINLTQELYEDNFLKFWDWKIRPLEHLENSQDTRINLFRLFTVTITK